MLFCYGHGNVPPVHVQNSTTEAAFFLKRVWRRGVCSHLYTCMYVHTFQRGKNHLTKDISKQKPSTRNKITSTDKTLSFYLQDDCQLLLHPRSAPHPYVISKLDVLSLANLLICNYKDIVAAAKPYAFIAKAGHQKESELL